LTTIKIVADPDIWMVPLRNIQFVGARNRKRTKREREQRERERRNRKGRKIYFLTRTRECRYNVYHSIHNRASKIEGCAAGWGIVRHALSLPDEKKTWFQISPQRNRADAHGSRLTVLRTQTPDDLAFDRVFCISKLIEAIRDIFLFFHIKNIFVSGNINF